MILVCIVKCSQYNLLFVFVQYLYWAISFSGDSSETLAPLTIKMDKYVFFRVILTYLYRLELIQPYFVQVKKELFLVNTCWHRPYTKFFYIEAFPC